MLVWCKIVSICQLSLSLQYLTFFDSQKIKCLTKKNNLYNKVKVVSTESLQCIAIKLRSPSRCLCLRLILWTKVWGEIMRVGTEWVIWSKKSIDVSNTLMYVSIQYWLRFTPYWLWLDEQLEIINGITFVAIKSCVRCYPSLTIPFITSPGRDLSELEISNRK